MNNTTKTIQNHRSIRKYLEKEIPTEILEDILKSAHHMPTSANCQAASVIVIKNPETKAALAKACGNQTHVAKAPVFLVFILDFTKTEIAGQIAGKPQVINEGVEGTLVGALAASYAAAATMICAESYGLGVANIGGIRNNPAEVIKLLNLPPLTFPLVGMCLGYPAEPIPEKKPRLPIDTFVHYEKFQNSNYTQSISQYDKLMAGYLESIGRAQKEVNWSFSIADMFKSIYYPEVFPTMQKQKFNNK